MGTSPSHEEAHSQYPQIGNQHQPVFVKLGGSNRSSSLPVNHERASFNGRGSEAIQQIRNYSQGPMPSKPMQTTFNKQSQSQFQTQYNPQSLYSIDQQIININNKFNPSSHLQDNFKKTYQPSSRIYQNTQTINSSARMNPNYGSQVMTQATLTTQPVNIDEIKIDSRIKFSKPAPPPQMNNVVPFYPAGSSVVLYDSSAGQNNSMIQNRECNIINNYNQHPQQSQVQIRQQQQPTQQQQQICNQPSQQIIQQQLVYTPVISTNPPPPSSIILADRLKLFKKHPPQVSVQNQLPPQSIIQQNHEPKISNPYQLSFGQPTPLVPQYYPSSYDIKNTSISTNIPIDHPPNKIISSSKKPFLNCLIPNQVQQDQQNQITNPGILSKHQKEQVITVDLLPITNNYSSDFNSQRYVSCQLDNKNSIINSPLNKNTKEIRNNVKEEVEEEIEELQEDSGTLAYSMSNNKKSSFIKNIMLLQSSEQRYASSCNMNARFQQKSPGSQVAQRLDALFNLGEDKRQTITMRCRESSLGSLSANSPQKDTQELCQEGKEFQENYQASRLTQQINNTQQEKEQDGQKDTVVMEVDKLIQQTMKLDEQKEKIAEAESQNTFLQEQGQNILNNSILRFEKVHGHSRRPSGNLDGGDHIRQQQSLSSENPLIAINRQDIDLNNSRNHVQDLLNYKFKGNSIPQLNEDYQCEQFQETNQLKKLGEQKSFLKGETTAHQNILKESYKYNNDLLVSIVDQNQEYQSKIHEFETNQSIQQSSRILGEDIISKESDDQIKNKSANIPRIQPSVQKKPEFSLEDRSNFLANLSYISFHLSKPGFHEQFSNSLNNTMCEENNDSRIDNCEKCSSEEKLKKYNPKKKIVLDERLQEQKDNINLNLLQMMPSKINKRQGQYNNSLNTSAGAGIRQESKLICSNSVMRSQEKGGNASKPNEIRLDISKQIEFQRIRALSCNSNEQLVEDIVSEDSNRLSQLSQKNLEIKPQKFKNIDDLENIQVFIHFPNSATSSSSCSTEENNQQQQQNQHIHQDQLFQQPISTTDSYQDKMIQISQKNNILSIKNPINQDKRQQHLCYHDDTVQKSNSQKEEDKRINKIILEEISAVTQETFPSEKRSTMFLMNGQDNSKKTLPFIEQQNYMIDLDNQRKSSKEINQIHEISNIENLRRNNNNNNRTTTNKRINNQYSISNKQQQQQQVAHLNHTKQEQSKIQTKFQMNSQPKNQQLHFNCSPLETQTLSEQDLSSTYLGTTIQYQQNICQQNSSSARSGNIRNQTLTKHANTAFHALSNSSRSRFTTFSEKDSEILFKYDPLTDSLFPISEIMGRHSQSVDVDRHAVKKSNQEASRSSSAATNRQNNEEIINANAGRAKLRSFQQTEAMDRRNNKQKQIRNNSDKNSINSYKSNLKSPYFQDSNLYTSVLEKFSNLLVKQPQTAQKQKQQQSLFTAGNNSVNQNYISTQKHSNQKQSIHKNYQRK